MRAAVGDRLCVHGRIVGQHDRTGEIIEVHGSDNQPPFLVRFEDGQERLMYPGPDCEVVSAGK
ncbi:MAG: DUF1918 domain-containing protein [Actinomycetota bacterium]|nr:DUF1918 domain-containing protein [Actinomycetota bacterium]